MKTYFLAIAVSLVFTQLLFAEEPREKSAFEQALESHTDVSTKESIVILKGQKFRKIEYGAKSYYLQLLQEETDTSKLVALCGDLAADSLVASRLPRFQLAPAS